MINKRSLCIFSPVHLSLKGNTLVISHKNPEGREPTEMPKDLSPEEQENFRRYFPRKDQRLHLDDIAIIVADNPATSYSSQVLSAFAQNNIILVVCDATHMPSGLLLAFEGHHMQRRFMESQINLKLTEKKRLWQCLIKAKIKEQASCLLALGCASDATKKLFSLSSSVASGDTSNNEALAARIYWDSLFGEDFRRIKGKGKKHQNSDAPPQADKDISLDSGNSEESFENRSINIALNYGYSIIRSLVARGIVVVGLHPGFSLFHANRFNAFCLVDDCMEPLRPLVDMLVVELYQETGSLDLQEIKPKLIDLLHLRIEFQKKEYPLIFVVQKYCESIRDSIHEKKALQIPEFILKGTSINS